MNDVVQNFGLRLQALRRERGYSVAALAEQLGIIPDMVRKVERGAASPSFRLLLKISTVLRLDPLLLFTFPGSGPQHDLVELTRGSSKSAVRAMLRTCAEIASKDRASSKGAGEG